MNFHEATSRSLTSKPLNRGTKMLNRGLQQEAPSLIYSTCCCSVAKLCLTLRDAMDCSAPGSSVHGIFQARVLEWGAIAPQKMLKNSRQENF